MGVGVGVAVGSGVGVGIAVGVAVDVKGVAVGVAVGVGVGSRRYAGGLKVGGVLLGCRLGINGRSGSPGQTPAGRRLWPQSHVLVASRSGVGPMVGNDVGVGSTGPAGDTWRPSSLSE